MFGRQVRRWKGRRVFTGERSSEPSISGSVHAEMVLVEVSISKSLYTVDHLTFTCALRAFLCVLLLVTPHDRSLKVGDWPTHHAGAFGSAMFWKHLRRPRRRCSPLRTHLRVTPHPMHSDTGLVASSLQSPSLRVCVSSGQRPVEPYA